jgi:hypothetical protein
MVDLRLTKLLRPQPEQEAQMLRATVARGVGQLGATAMFGRRADVSRTRLPLVKQSTLAKRLRQSLPRAEAINSSEAAPESDELLQYIATSTPSSMFRVAHRASMTDVAKPIAAGGHLPSHHYDATAHVPRHAQRVTWSRLYTPKRVLHY